MIVKGIENIRQYPNLTEDLIIAICNYKFSAVEFDENYEPEIKLKILSEKFTQFQEEDQAGQVFYRGPNNNFFVDTLYGILKRLDAKTENYNSFFHIILALELIKPSDANHILRSLIQEAKFINVNSPTSDLNLHIRIIDVYMNLITDSESINFIGEYLYEEFKRKRLLIYPNFYIVFLRHFLRFKSINDYFWAVQSCLPLCKNNNDGLYRVRLSIDEFIRVKKAYSDLYRWLNTDFTKFYKINPDFDPLPFLKQVEDWAKRRRKYDDNRYLELILAKINLFGLHYSFDGAITHLKAFSEGNWNDNFSLKQIGWDFFDLIRVFKIKGYVVEDNLMDQTPVIFISKKTDLFARHHAPHCIKIPSPLFGFYASTYYPKKVIQDYPHIPEPYSHEN